MPWIRYLPKYPDMIGIDVVDLEIASAFPHSDDEGFLEKILLPGERELPVCLETGIQWIWIAWSIKEATYKAIQHYGIWERFIPRNFEISSCHQDIAVDDHICYEGICAGIVTRTSVTPGHITSWAYLPGVEIPAVYSGVYMDGNSVEMQVRKIYNLSFLPEIRHYESGMPYLEVQDSRKLYLTVSHHGKKKMFAVYRPA